MQPLIISTWGKVPHDLLNPKPSVQLPHSHIGSLVSAADGADLVPQLTMVDGRIVVDTSTLTVQAQQAEVATYRHVDDAVSGLACLVPLLGGASLGDRFGVFGGLFRVALLGVCTCTASNCTFVCVLMRPHPFLVHHRSNASLTMPPT